MTPPRPAVKKVIAEWSEDGWLTMTPDGGVEVHASPEAVLRWLGRLDARQGTGFDVTVLEWRNVPAGFIPPTSS